MSQQPNTPNSGGVQTTGHVWDDTLQEYNNPLPNWWLWTFYGTLLLSLVYWFTYPAFPVGKSYTKGFNTITYVNSAGEKVTTHWNMRSQLMKEMNEQDEKQKPYFKKISSMSYTQIAKDPEALGFVNSAGKALFNENCAACHQVGGGGKVGYFPNLTDDDWLYGGTHQKIEETLKNGRRGYMPPFKEVLDENQITNLASYVLSLSGVKVDPARAEEGNKLFHSETAACYYCHNTDAKGRQVIGAPNLTDKIWLWANVPEQNTPEGKLAEVKTVITNGLNKGVMPAWKERLKPEQIKVLTAYVHALGGGK